MKYQLRFPDGRTEIVDWPFDLVMAVVADYYRYGVQVVVQPVGLT